MYEYNVRLVRVVDGDTVDVDIDLGFGIWLHKERIRLYGIDTPESRTRDLEEHKYGKLATKFVERFLDDPKGLILKTAQYNASGKFGRILGTLWRKTDFADKSVNDYLIDKYLAVPYTGQSKEAIQEAHIKNRKHVNLNMFDPDYLE